VIRTTVLAGCPRAGSGRIVGVTSPAPVPDPAALLALAVDTAGEAGRLVAEGRASAGREVGVKSSATDVVTAVDTASERLIVGRLLAARPDDGVLGEEGAAREGSSGVRWVVDPIDGTVNFLYGLPAYAVSIAAEVDGVVRAGAVLNAATGELFTATTDGGAWLTTPARPDPVRLTAGHPASLEQTLVGTGFGYRVEQRRAQAAVVAALLPRVRDIRRIGSSALDLCATAAGRLDAFYEMHLNPWDHAAGALVAAEAGVVLAGLPGRPFAEPMAIAAAPTVADAFVALLAELVDQQADS
jgi:myo-inositol-1(or 4)-monophosphatase